MQNLGVEVLVDRLTLKSGARWRPEIYSWMLLAHSAVIILTDSAKKSRWVPREAMILRWREEMDKNFQLHIVLGGTFKIEDLSKGAYRDLGLNDINVVTDGDLTSMLAKLNSQSSPNSDKLPLRLGEIFCDVYDKLAQDRRLEASECVGFDLGSWETQFKPLELFTVQLAHYGFREIPPRGKQTPEYPGVTALRKLRQGLEPATRQNILNVLAPAWVDYAAAAALREEARRSQYRLLVLTAGKARTFQHYLDQAWSQEWDGAPRCFALSEPLPDTKPTRLEELRAALFATLRSLMPADSQTWPELADYLKETSESHRPVFVYVLGSGTQSLSFKDVAMLRNDQPHIVFVWISQTRPSNPPDYQLIRPILRASVEAQAVKDYNRAHIDLS